MNKKLMTFMTLGVLGLFAISIVSATGFSRSDFNEDEKINGLDFVMLRSSIQFDLNGDGVVDYSDLTSPDRIIYTKCIKKFFAVGECVKADFDGNGFITPLDSGVLLNAINKYDLNGDGKIVLKLNPAAESDLRVFIQDWKASK